MEQGFVPDTREAVPIDRLLEWTYRQQRADMVVGMGAGLERGEAAVDGVLVRGTSACGCAAVARIAELGCRVDATGGPPGHLHVDAERVHEAVNRLSRPVGMMLMRHARVGSIPETHLISACKAKAVLNGRREVSVRYDPWDKNRNYGWCPVEWSISIARIEAARLEYVMWWDGMAAVAREVGGTRLSAHLALPPGVPREPWARVSH